MSTRIVFNGTAYDGVEAMPPDVRLQYQAVLDALGASERSKLESAMGSGAGIKINTTVRRRFKVGGKEYDSVDAMPPEIRRAYEQAVAGTGTPAEAGFGATPPASAPPPAIDGDDSRTGRLFRIAIFAAMGVVVLVWLLLKLR